MLSSFNAEFGLNASLALHLKSIKKHIAIVYVNANICKNSFQQYFS